MTRPLNPDIQAITNGLDRNLQALMLLYTATQKKESDKTPSNARVFIANIRSPAIRGSATTYGTVPIMARNPSRYDLTISNQGPSDIIFGNKDFDPATILGRVSDPNNADAVLPAYNQIIADVGILVSGQAITLRTKNGIWVYNVNATAGSNQNALLSFVETEFEGSMDWASKQAKRQSGQDGNSWYGRDLGPYTDDQQPYATNKIIN